MGLGDLIFYTAALGGLGMYIIYQFILKPQANSKGKKNSPTKSQKATPEKKKGGANTKGSSKEKKTPPSRLSKKPKRDPFLERREETMNKSFEAEPLEIELEKMGKTFFSAREKLIRQSKELRTDQFDFVPFHLLRRKSFLSRGQKLIQTQEDLNKAWLVSELMKRKYFKREMADGDISSALDDDLQF